LSRDLPWPCACRTTDHGGNSPRWHCRASQQEIPLYEIDRRVEADGEMVVALFEERDCGKQSR
jgi:hypothetical protein